MGRGRTHDGDLISILLVDETEDGISKEGPGQPTHSTKAGRGQAQDDDWLEPEDLAAKSVDAVLSRQDRYAQHRRHGRGAYGRGQVVPSPDLAQLEERVPVQSG